MLNRILFGIFFGGIIGCVSSLFFASAMNASDSTVVYATYLGIISGLLICLIIEVNHLHNKLK